MTRWHADATVARAFDVDWMGTVSRSSGGLPDREDARLRSLADMARTLGRHGTLAEIIELAAEEARRVLAAASASVSRVEDEGTIVRTLVNVGVLGPTEEHWPEDETYALADYPRLNGVVTALNTWSYTLDQPNVDPKDEPEEAVLLRALGKTSAVAAPIVVDGDLWGELYLTREAGRPPFGPTELAYLETLSCILAAGVSRTLHVERLEQLARTDPLTRLGNRRALEGSLAQARAALAAGRSVAVIAVDVDGLKTVNDQHGHASGDTVLVAVASALRAVAQLLPQSTAARVGGDEFVIVSIGTSGAAIRAAVDGIDREGLLPYGAGLSVGIAASEDHQAIMDVDELVELADQEQCAVKASRARGRARRQSVS